MKTEKVLEELFSVKKPVIGVVHLLPLPGSPRYKDLGISNILDRAVQDAKNLEAGGVNGLIVENLGDAPYLKTNVGPETVSTMTLAVREVINAVNIPTGVNVLRNDVKAALAIAQTTGGKFIRANVFTETIITDQGIIEPTASELLRYRRYLGAEGVKVFADVHVKHGIPLSFASIEESAKEAAYRGLADALIVTGTRTGVAPNLKDLARVRKAVPDKPLLIGSGATRENILKLLKYTDGAIVGTSLKNRGVTENPVDLERVKAFTAIVENARKCLST